MPTAWQAFLDYRMQATALSRLESEIVRALAAGNAARATALLQEAGLLERTAEGEPKANFERREIEEKLTSLGWKVEW